MSCRPDLYGSSHNHMLAKPAREEPAAVIDSWVKQLHSSDPEEQAAAAYELGELIAAPGRNKDLVVNAGAIPSLVAILGSGSSKVQEEAAALLQSLASNGYHAAIDAAGGISALVCLLRNGSGVAQRDASMTLCYLASSDSSLKPAIISAGSVPVLSELCNSSSAQAQLAAAAALCSVAAGNKQLEPLLTTQAFPALLRLMKPNTEGTALDPSRQLGGSSTIARPEADDKTAMTQGALQIAAVRACYTTLCDATHCPGVILPLQLAAGVPEALVALLRDENSLVQSHAAEVLCGYLNANDYIAAIFAAAGAIPALVLLLYSSRTDTQHSAAEALSVLVADDKDNKSAFVAAGGLDVLAASVGVPHKQEHALELLAQLLTDGGSSIQAAVASVGFTVPVTQLLSSTDKEVALRAICVLSELVKQHSNNQAVAAKAGAIPVMIALLKKTDPQSQYGASMLLLVLTHDNTSNTAAFAAAGGIEAVVQAMGDCDSEVHGVTIDLLRQVVSSHSSYQAAALAAGAIPALVCVLKNSIEEGQISAAGALAYLAIPCTQLHIVAGMSNLAVMEDRSKADSSNKTAWHAAAEAVPVLVSLLKEGSTELQQAAAVALGNMFARSSAISHAFEDSGGHTVLASMTRSSNRQVQQLAAMLLNNIKAASTYDRLSEVQPV